MANKCPSSSNGTHQYQNDVVEVDKAGGGKERIIIAVCRWCGAAKPGYKGKHRKSGGN